MANVEALNASNITTIGVIVIIALVVIGALLSLVITALIGRIIILVVVIVLGVFVWQQRSSVEDKINANKCNFSASFFGIHLDAPDSLKKHCPKLD